MNQIIQTVPNFSEGRNKENIEKIVDCFRNRQGVVLLDYSSDADHNRTVVTAAGEREPLKAAVIEAVGLASQLIDLRKHEGQHPRMGATDVVPFIPVQNSTTEECIEISKEVAKEVYDKFGIPSFLYEQSAAASHRVNLAAVRKGQFEGMAEKIKEDKWKPDFGSTIHESAGITAIGARMPLVAYNVNLNSTNVDNANQIARNVRHLSGGLRFVKGIGIDMPEQKMTQVSMNLTDFSKTPIYRAFELIKIEATRYNEKIVESEVIGLVPKAALTETLDFYLKDADYDKNDYDFIAREAVKYLKIKDFSVDQILEKNIDDKLKG